MFNEGDKVYFTVCKGFQREVLDKEVYKWVNQVKYGVLHKIKQRSDFGNSHTHCVAFENAQTKEVTKFWFKPEEIVKYQTNKRGI